MDKKSSSPAREFPRTHPREAGGSSRRPLAVFLLVGPTWFRFRLLGARLGDAYGYEILKDLAVVATCKQLAERIELW